MVVSSSHLAVVPPVMVLLFYVRAEPTKYSLELEETDLKQVFRIGVAHGGFTWLAAAGGRYGGGGGA